MLNDLPGETPPANDASGQSGGEASAAPKPRVPDHELMRRIGAGSYGEVWLARSVMGTYRAVKVVYRSRFEHDRPYEREFNGIERFEPISRAHVGLMDILQVGRNDEERYFYYVMEVADDEVAGQNFDPTMYEARTLRSAITNRRFKSFSECLELCLSLTSAVGHLHEHELIHRDIKPANIIFVNGVPKLADIGLVTEIGSESIAGGTMGYLAPEGVASPKADIYSLGKVFYEVMTGKDRFEFPELPQHWGDATDDDKFLELNEVVIKACESNPAQRYQSAEEMHGDLVLLQTGKSVRRLRTLERRLSLLTRIGVGVAALGLLAGAAYYQIYREKVVTTRQLAGSYIAYGTRTMDDGDLLGSLPWLAKAMSLGNRNQAEDETDRVRIAAVLQQSPMILRLWFHDEMVHHAEFSRDGRYVLTSCHNGIVTVWDVEKDALVARLVGHTGEVEKAAFSPNGRQIVTAGADRSARLWEAATGRELRVLPHPAKVFSVAFDSRGERIVTACDDGFVRIWDAAPDSALPKPIAEFRAQEHGVRDAVFSPDGTRVAAAGEDGKAAVWDWSTGQSVGQIVKHHPGEQWVYYVSFSPDGRYFATASSDSLVNICDAVRGEIMRTLELVVPVYSVEWSPDGRYLVTASSDFMARIWEVSTGKKTGPPLKHNSYLLHAAFSPDGDRVVTSTTGGTCSVWDVTRVNERPPPLLSLVDARPGADELTARSRDENPQKSATVTDPGGEQFLEVRLSRDGSRAVAFTFHSLPSLHFDTPIPCFTTARLRETASWKALSPPLVCTNTPWKSAISDDGHRLATVVDSRIQTWDTVSGRLLTTIALARRVEDFFFDPAGDRLVTLAKKQSQAQVWSSTSGTLQFVLPDDNPITMGAFSLDGASIVTVAGTSVSLWDAATGTRRLRLPHENSVDYAAFSPNGQRLVTCQQDLGLTPLEAQIWDLRTGHKVGAPMKHRDGIFQAAFSPDGQRLVTASEDFTAQVWDARTGLPLSQLLRHKHKVYGAAFSPDGRWVVTASQDATARIWDVQNGEPVTPPFRPGWPVRNAQFLGDGHRIIIKRRSNADSRLLEFPRDSRRVEDLVALSELLSGHTIDRNGGALPLTKPALRQVWAALQARDPGERARAGADLIRWHEAEAQASEKEKQWTAALFHWERLLKARPDNATWRRRHSSAEAAARADGQIVLQKNSP
jgi:WD40 repeat protein